MKKILSATILAALSIILFTQQVSAQSQADREKAQACYKQGLEQIEASKFAEAYESFRNACQLDTANSDYKVRYMVISSYMGQQALFAGNHAKALALFTTAFTIKRELTKDEDDGYVTLKRYIELTEEHKKYYPVKPEYTYKIQVLYLMNTDIKDTYDKKNQPIICKGSIPKKFPDQMVRYHEMLRIYIETLSRGRLSLSFHPQKVDATITRVVELFGYSPDFNSIQPSLSPLLYAGRNTYDTILYYWYKGKLPFSIHASWDGSVILAPYAWRSSAVRGRIVLCSTNEATQMDHISHLPHHWIAFHEFFHHIEYLSGNIAPMHAYLPEEFQKARKNFPAWVPDMNPSWTATEYSWYKYHILNTVPPRMEELARETGIHPPWRNMSYVNRFPDTTDEKLYKTYNEALEKVSLPDRQKAADLVDQGFKLMRAGKHRESQASFEQAYKHNPYHHQALFQLGWGAIYYYKDDFARADRYYREMARVFPDPKKCFEIGATFLERNQGALAAPYFRIAAERPGANPVYAWWAATALAGAGDAAGAEAMMRLIGKHPVVNAPVAFLVCRAADVTPCTGNRPEEEVTPTMLKPYRSGSARWRLVPAGAGTQVRIVSDYNWLCLETRTKAGAATVVLAPIGKKDTQVWQMERGKDGSWRVVSKTANLSLAVVPAAAGKQPILTLRPASADPFQKWDIETLDPAVAIMDTLRTASLISPSGMALDVAGGSMADGAPIKQLDWGKDNWNQKWKLVPSGTAGFVLIISARTLKCVAAVENDGFVKPLQQTITRSDEQLWKIVPKSGGRFLLVNRLNGQALQPDAWEKNSLMLGPVENTENQLWKIEY